jgi:multicomponent K+:H+ antiporter subunit D
MVDLLERNQGGVAAMLAVTAEAYGFGDEELDADEPTAELALPGTMTVLGLCFAACALLLAGLPPLSGFVGKFAILTAVFNPNGLTQGSTLSLSAWTFVSLLVLSGLAAMIAITRSGIQTFWAPIEGRVPRVLLMEIAPVAFLLTLCVGLTVFGGPAMRYMEQTAQALHSPATYIEGVMHAPRVPSPAKEAAP